MFYQGDYFIDLSVLFHLYQNNIWYVIKILIMGYVAFIYLPTKIFPQEYTGNGIRKIIYNVIYMLAYIEVVVPTLVLLKFFSILIFALALLITKLAFKKWYYKEDPIQYLVEIKRKILLFIFDSLDAPQIFINNIKNYGKNRYFALQKSFTFANVAEKTLFFSVFFYILVVLMIKGMYSYSDPASDTSQYIEWVGSIQKNILYADNKTFGAYFYGMPVSVFFIGLITNIDQVILFTLYPVLLWFFLFLSVYFILKEVSHSKYVGLFGVMILGMVFFMTPIADAILGTVVVTDYPVIKDIFGFHFYVPSPHDVAVNGKLIGYQPYNRFMSSLAYEHSTIFVILSTFFLIRTIQTRSNEHLTIYLLSVFLIFIFHAGAAITLIVVSLLITFVAIMAGKYQFQILKKLIIGIVTVAFFGSFWILSMIKYGIPPEVGAAAPFLDDLLGTKGLAHTVKAGFQSVSIVDFTYLHFSYFVMLIIAIVTSFFTKRKFLNIAFLMYPLGVFIAYYGPHAGTIVLSRQGRLAEYLFLALTVLYSYFYYYFFYIPVRKIFKSYAKRIIISVMYIIFIVLALALPKWYDSHRFWHNINMVQYTSIPDAILKINSENRPFSWSAVAYVQSFSKVRNKGYHLNTQNFLINYKPQSKYLAIPTEKVFIFTENEKNAYRGLGQWYYRWRGNIQGNLKGWVALYKLTHNNIKIYYESKTITVYEIDNQAYIQYLREKGTN